MELVQGLHLAAGAALALAAWLVPRWVARAGWTRPAALLLDIAPIAAGAGLLALASGRPLFAGVVMLALGAGFTLADHTMRETLHEPAVFSEAVELPQVFTHPHLYLPFAGPGLVLGGAAGAGLLAVALLLAEPPLWEPRPVAGLLIVALSVAAGAVFAWHPPLGVAAAVLRRLFRPTGEPFADAAALGPFAMLMVHAVIARAERSDRQQALAAPAVHSGGAAPDEPPPAGPIVVVQCESFFDARRLSPLVPAEMVAGFAQCLASASQHGRLAVPGWGANTMRAEFAVLTGIPESELGYDRFNPYYALARKPLASHVWRLRQAGYRTVCLHPFDRRFFRRDLAMPALGFERFLGRETLGGSRTPPYYPDPLLAEDILRIVESEGPNVLVFAITMGNHGPWLTQAAAGGGPLDAPEIPGGAALRCYLDGLRRADEMLQVLMAGLARRSESAVLAFYGDHLPSLPPAFAHFGFAETASDYVIWRGPAGRHGGPPARRDIAAHQLGQYVIDAARHDPDALVPPVREACAAAPEPPRFAR